MRASVGDVTLQGSRQALTHGRPVTLAPSRLEYAFALDWLARTLGDCGVFPAQLLAAVSTPEFVDLVLARTGGTPRFLPAAGETDAHIAERVQQGYFPTADATASEQPTCAVWAAPQRATWVQVLTVLGERLAPGGRIGILVSTRTGAAVAPLRHATSAGEPVPVPGLVAALTQRGWRIQARRGFGGAVGVWWALLARAAARRHRLDLADRAEHAYLRCAASGTAPTYLALVAGI